MKEKIEQWCEDEGFYLEDSYTIYGSELANIIYKFVQANNKEEAKERYEKARRYLKEHNRKGEWDVTMDALRIASGYKKEE